MSSRTKQRVRTCLSVTCASEDCTGPNEETKRCCLAPGAVVPCRNTTLTVANENSPDLSSGDDQIFKS